MSPNYPRHYKHNSECEWDIRAPANYSIEIMFHDFQLESTFSCKGVNRPCICDYVEILKETGHGNMTRTGIYCMMRNYPPRVIDIPSSHVTVIFRSDATISERGFLAKYKMRPLYSGITFLVSRSVILRCTSNLLFLFLFHFSLSLLITFLCAVVAIIDISIIYVIYYYYYC